MPTSFGCCFYAKTDALRCGLAFRMYIHIYIYTHMSACIHTYRLSLPLLMYVCICMYVCLYVCMYVCIHVCIYVYTFIYIYICMHMHITHRYIHICIYIYVFTFTHTYIYIDRHTYPHKDDLKERQRACGLRKGSPHFWQISFFSGVWGCHKGCE